MRLHSGTKHNIFEHLEDFLDEQEREAFLKAVEACGGDEYEVAQVFEQGGYLQRALSRIGKTPTPGYEYKPIIYTKADGTKFVRIVEVEKNASTKTPDEDGFTKTNIIDDKNSSHTEERIYWGPWRRTTQIAEKPKADTEQEHSDEDNTATTIQKNDVNNKDSKGNRSNDKQGEKTRGNSTETTGNPKDNSKKENTDPNRERRVELGKTIGIETFKFGGDLPVTLLNKQADSLAKEYRSLQKEIPAYVVKQGRLTKVGVLSPLGLIYDTYQDAQKYNGEKFVVATVINGASFLITSGLDSSLTATGVGIIAVPFVNVGIATFTDYLKGYYLNH